MLMFSDGIRLVIIWFIRTIVLVAFTSSLKQGYMECIGNGASVEL